MLHVSTVLIAVSSLSLSLVKSVLSFVHGALCEGPTRACQPAKSEREGGLFLSSVSLQQLLLSCGLKRGVRLYASPPWARLSCMCSLH
jgi:hypothetical protein